MRASERARCVHHYNNAKAGDPVVHAISLALTLFVFWLLLSGHYSPILVGTGFATAVTVVFFARRMSMLDREGHPIHVGLTVVTYWPWLVKEIVKSAWNVAIIIVDPRLPISPTMVRFRPRQKTPVGLVIHANSITLTPATMCVDATAREFTVHALTRDGAAAVADSEMDRRVARLEGRG
jgi:multicomponent Na+:H+ antiporter subunit E